MSDADYKKLAEILRNESKRKALAANAHKTLADEGAGGVDDNVKKVLEDATEEELAFLARFRGSLEKAGVPGGIQVDMV